MGKTVHHTTTDELLDTLALHAMDLLDQHAAAEVEEHLAEGCEVCKQHVYAFRQAFAALAHTVPTAQPRTHVREQLIGRIGDHSRKEDWRLQPDVGAQVWKAWTPESAAAVNIIRSSDEQWEKVHAGIWAKRLYVDPEHDTVTMLVRMDPGASYIPHRHGGAEQCFVLEGDLREGDLIVTAGDYQCAAKGSVHGAQWTESGCLLLIVSSLQDELL
jgi:quercetin dioxygenase-like cupin family protein